MYHRDPAPAPRHVHTAATSIRHRIGKRIAAACTGGNEVTCIIHNTVIRALAQIPTGPDGSGPHVMACDHGSSNNMTISGHDPGTGERYVIYEYPEGGWGANGDRDGLSAIRDEILARDPDALPGATSNHCYFCWYALTRGLASGVSGGGGKVGAWVGERPNHAGELIQLGVRT